MSNKAYFKTTWGQLILALFGGKANYPLLGVTNTGPSGVGLFILKNIHKTAQLLKSCIHENRKVIISLKDNPPDPETKIDPGFLEEVEKYAMDLGVGAIGCARLPRRLIFKDRAVLFDNAMVLLKEMDKEKIARAPSPETLQMVFETCDSLGIAVNRLTEYLRMGGYSAQGVHPLGGLGKL